MNGLDITEAFRALLAPRSIAIIGASDDFNKLNGRTLKALIDKSYRGAIYPVNPKYAEIAGLACFPNVAAIPGPVDLAVVAMPGKLVANTLRELGRKGVAAAVVFSSGFSEIGGAGHELDQELKAAIAESGVRVLGPNCLGFMNTFDNVMATFSQFALNPLRPGPVAMVTQSGALGTTTAGMALRRGIDFGYIVTTGNESDVNFVEVMRSVLADPRIRLGAGYLEGVKDGRGLLAVADAALAAGKPLIVTKLGRTKAGAKAVASHTGSLAGEDVVFEHVARQHGIVRARSDDSLLDLIHAFSTTPLPEGHGLGILTRSGGAGAMMADRAEDVGLSSAIFEPATVEALKRIVPAFGSVANPVDVTAQGIVDPSMMREALKTILADPNVHIGVAWLGFTKDVDFTVQTFIEVKQQSTKPFIVSWSSIPEDALVKLGQAGVAVMRGPELAVDAAGALARYAQARRQLLTERADVESLPRPSLSLPAASGAVGTLAAVRLLESCGVPMAPVRQATSADEAVAAAAGLGYPVVLKIESPDILHKTEANGVRLGLADAAAVRRAFAEVTASAAAYKPDARIDGVVLQAMASGNVELVVGLKKDPLFGVVVMVGLGGIFVEVLKDVVFRTAPVTQAQAGRMLEELKGAAMLDGVRGKPPVDRQAVARLISAVSIFGAQAGDRLEELDLNPILASERGVVAVDALMVLG